MQCRLWIIQSCPPSHSASALYKTLPAGWILCTGVYNDPSCYKPEDYSDVGQAEVLAEYFSSELRYSPATTLSDTPTITGRNPNRAHGCCPRADPKTMKEKPRTTCWKHSIS